MSNTRTKYKNDWQRDHADRIGLNVPKGQKAVIRDHAQARGESINSFINRAINEAIERDPQKDERDRRIAQIVEKTGKSIKQAEHDIEIEDALTLLEREVPDIRSLYFSKRQELLSALRAIRP